MLWWAYAQSHLSLCCLFMRQVTKSQELDHLFVLLFYCNVDITAYVHPQSYLLFYISNIPTNLKGGTNLAADIILKKEVFLSSH